MKSPIVSLLLETFVNTRARNVCLYSLYNTKIKVGSSFFQVSSSVKKKDKSATKVRKKENKVSFCCIWISFSIWSRKSTLLPIMLLLFFSPVPSEKEKKSKKSEQSKTDVAAPGGDDSDSDSSLDVEKWKKWLMQMSGRHVQEKELLKRITLFAFFIQV